LSFGALPRRAITGHYRPYTLKSIRRHSRRRWHSLPIAAECDQPRIGFDQSFNDPGKNYSRHAGIYFSVPGTARAVNCDTFTMLSTMYAKKLFVESNHVIQIVSFLVADDW
jgi:hypothetical protein